MNTIDRILGRNPSNQHVDDEFNNRNLSLNGFNDTVTTHNLNRYSIAGHYSTLSDNPHTAAKKLLIIEDEIERRPQETKKLETKGQSD